MANPASEIDLDFHIQFPTPADSESENRDEVVNKLRKRIASSKNNKPDSEKEPKDVLVVLLGWAGAQDKYLSKYSEFYRNQGCIVLRYISPIKVLFVDTGKLPLLAARFVRLLKELQLESHPTFFHVFSNGGGFMYSYILRELAAIEDCQIDLRGTIFDSSPSPRNLSTVYRALSNIFSGFGSGFNGLMAICVVFILILQVFWHHLKAASIFCIWGESLSDSLEVSSRRREDAPLQNWIGRMSRLRNHSCLFIYSEADELIPFSQVEMFANCLEKHGNRVTRWKLIDSAHVQHFRKYPEEYIKAVTDFIHQTMEENKGRTILWKEY